MVGYLVKGACVQVGKGAAAPGIAFMLFHWHCGSGTLVAFASQRGVWDYAAHFPPYFIDDGACHATASGKPGCCRMLLFLGRTSDMLSIVEFSAID